MIRKSMVVLGVLVVLSGTLVWCAYRRDLAAARARIESASSVVNTACGTMEYADLGDGPAILAIHGAGGGFDQSVDLARAFLSQHYRIIAPSRFGYLRTPLPADASPMAQADAHACLLDALHLQKVIVAGGSMGAPSAMQFCIRHPDRCSALILLFPIAFAPRPPGEPPPIPSPAAQFVMATTLKSDFLFWSVLKLSPDALMRNIGATPPEDVKNASPDEQKRVHAILDHILPVSERAKGLMNDAAVAPVVPRYELERITAPTLVISAEDDLFGTYKGGRYTAEHVAGARFVGYPTGGHLLVGHGDDVRQALSEFLKVHTSSAAATEVVK